MELGVFIRDCPCVASDLLKVFESYWLLSQTHTQTNDKANTSPALYNLDHPLTINYRGLDADIYIAVRCSCPDERLDFDHSDFTTLVE